MQAEDLYEQLNVATPSCDTLNLLYTFLREQVAYGASHPSEQCGIAYKMAGLLSAQSIRARSEDDPIKRMLLVAGWLELPLQHRPADVTWDKFVQMLSGLSVEGV